MRSNDTTPSVPVGTLRRAGGTSRSSSATNRKAGSYVAVARPANRSLSSSRRGESGWWRNRSSRCCCQRRWAAGTSCDARTSAYRALTRRRQSRRGVERHASYLGCSPVPLTELMRVGSVSWVARPILGVYTPTIGRASAGAIMLGHEYGRGPVLGPAGRRPPRGSGDGPPPGGAWDAVPTSCSPSSPGSSGPTSPCPSTPWKPKRSSYLQRVANIGADARCVPLPGRPLRRRRWSSLWWVRVHGLASRRSPPVTDVVARSPGGSLSAVPDAPGTVVEVILLASRPRSRIGARRRRSR